mmetsp:Transcript_20718/g.28943  ORF Transcript_20718/g.28943 Transcript_20718/m.28943 type:complete len:152 (-) Transcript_20718:195-650(-)
MDIYNPYNPFTPRARSKSQSPNPKESPNDLQQSPAMSSPGDRTPVVYTPGDVSPSGIEDDAKNRDPRSLGKSKLKKNSIYLGPGFAQMLRRLNIFWVVSFMSVCVTLAQSMISSNGAPGAPRFRRRGAPEFPPASADGGFDLNLLPPGLQY